MTNLEKLKIILPHWISHNQQHIAEFEHWAKLIEDSNNIQIKKALKKAICNLKDVTKELQHALELAGGPIDHSKILDHQHKHHHSNHH
jgi:alcohol dehydrogenase YqhD (iron-dependent ADH family)